jgi:hypothetical protein
MIGLRQGRTEDFRFAPFALLTLLLMLTGCATTSVLLDMNTLAAGDIGKAEAQELTYNAVRFEVLGGATYNLYYYLLYKDGFEVRTAGPLTNMGKMTLREARSKYDKDRHAHYFSRQSRATINEVVREGSVIGYALFNEEIELDLWEDTSQRDKSKIILILNYEDLRIAD